jgi:hypothetical protein
MKAMADYLGQPEAYAQKALEARIENSKLNAQADWTPLKDDKGNIAYTAFQLDNDSGVKERVYQIQGQPVSREQIQKAGFMKASERKTFAEAEYKKAGVKAAGLPKKGTEKTPTIGSMEKDVNLYMDAFSDEKLTKKQATQMVRKERSNVAMHDEMKEFIDSLDLMGDKPDEEQSAAIKAKREELMEKYEPVPTPKAGKKARGLPTDEKAKGGVPTDKLPAPKGLKEGQTAGKGQYIIKKGKWTIAK